MPILAFRLISHPRHVLGLIRVVRPWAAAGAIGFLGLGLIWGLAFSPPDYQQGETVRIMYVHVPAAWMALFVYSIMALASAAVLIWKNPVADVIAKGSAPLGTGFALICILTGSLWGRPMWGAFWVWDARLTSVLILFFFYLGYMALWFAIEDQAKAARAAAILALVGFVNVPVVKFSVDWWNTLHQPASVFTLQGPKIHIDLLWPLLLMGAGFAALYALLLMLRVEAELLSRRARTLRYRRSQA
jgi:heme exporter protein C